MKTRSMKTVRKNAQVVYSRSPHVGHNENWLQFSTAKQADYYAQFAAAAISMADCNCPEQAIVNFADHIADRMLNMLLMTFDEGALDERHGG